MVRANHYSRPGAQLFIQRPPGRDSGGINLHGHATGHRRRYRSGLGHWLFFWGRRKQQGTKKTEVTAREDEQTIHDTRGIHALLPNKIIHDRRRKAKVSEKNEQKRRKHTKENAKRKQGTHTRKMNDTKMREEE